MDFFGLFPAVKTAGYYQSSPCGDLEGNRVRQFGREPFDLLRLARSLRTGCGREEGILGGAPLRCARAYGGEEEFFFTLHPALAPSARDARLGPHWANFATRLSALTAYGLSHCDRFRRPSLQAKTKSCNFTFGDCRAAFFTDKTKPAISFLAMLVFWQSSAR